MALVVATAGLVRGFTGFGAGLFMAPLLFRMVGPLEAVPLLILLDGLVSFILLPGAVSKIDRRRLARLALPAGLALAPGSLLLTGLDARFLRIGISVVILATVLALWAGWRRRREPGPAGAAAIGAASGLLTGAAGIGGPPVILFHLSGDSAPEDVRANLIGFFTVTHLAAIALLTFRGLVTVEVAQRALVTAPVFLGAAWAGARLFGGRSGRGYRTVAYLLLAGSALLGLLAPGPDPG